MKCDYNDNGIQPSLEGIIIAFFTTIEKDSIFLGPRHKDFFYLIRFFEKDSFDYVSIECTINFPQFFCTDDEDCYAYDIDCMYLFPIKNRNVIIMDPNKFKLNSFVKLNDKKKVSLEQVNYFLKEFSIPFLRPSWYPPKRFFKIDSSELKPVFNIDTYPPYKNEIKMEVDIDELEVYAPVEPRLSD